MTSTPLRLRRAVAIATVAIGAAAGVAACSSSGASATGKSINLVAYSVPKPAYDALSAAFEKTSAGKGVSFKTSYGPSGDQAKKVLAGTKADYVGFSTGSDMKKLVPTKVADAWDSGATKGMVSDSVVVIVTRKGNPLGIKGWDDLIKPGVKIVTPDPASSGSAKWNILAAYTHILKQGGTEADAATYLKKFFKNVVSRAESGSVAATQFLAGTGNVLISYENEAIGARQAGKDVDYIVPDQSILIENPATVTKTASTSAKDFLSFVQSEQGQEIFVSKGFRPVLAGVKIGTVQGANDPSNPFPTVKQLTKISDLGGWSTVNDKFFGDAGIVTKIEAG